MAGELLLPVLSSAAYAKRWKQQHVDHDHDQSVFNENVGSASFISDVAVQREQSELEDYIGACFRKACGLSRLSVLPNGGRAATFAAKLYNEAARLRWMSLPHEDVGQHPPGLRQQEELSTSTSRWKDQQLHPTRWKEIFLNEETKMKKLGMLSNDNDPLWWKVVRVADWDDEWSSTSVFDTLIGDGKPCARHQGRKTNQMLFEHWTKHPKPFDERTIRHASFVTNGTEYWIPRSGFHSSDPYFAALLALCDCCNFSLDINATGTGTATSSRSPREAPAPVKTFHDMVVLASKVLEEDDEHETSAAAAAGQDATCSRSRQDSPRFNRANINNVKLKRATSNVEQMSPPVVRGTLQHQDVIDQKIFKRNAKALEDWEVEHSTIGHQKDVGSHRENDDQQSPRIHQESESQIRNDESSKIPILICGTSKKRRDYLGNYSGGGSSDGEEDDIPDAEHLQHEEDEDYHLKRLLPDLRKRLSPGQKRVFPGVDLLQGTFREMLPCDQCTGDNHGIGSDYETSDEESCLYPPRRWDDERRRPVLPRICPWRLFRENVDVKGDFTTERPLSVECLKNDTRDPCPLAADGVLCKNDTTLACHLDKRGPRRRAGLRKACADFQQALREHCVNADAASPLPPPAEVDGFTVEDEEYWKHMRDSLFPPHSSSEMSEADHLVLLDCSAAEMAGDFFDC
ncbi:unnamed protein product, partial [Amoebophrya sp. A25]|eukprot:GSA25T00004098001.1